MSEMLGGTLAGSVGYSRVADTPYHYLAASIITRAARDYVKITRRLWDKSLSANVKRGLILDRTEIEEFFYSEWYQALTDISPDRLITACKHRAREDEKEAIRRKNKRVIKKMMLEEKLNAEQGEAEKVLNPEGNLEKEKMVMLEEGDENV